MELYDRVLYSCVLASATLTCTILGGVAFGVFLSFIVALGLLEWTAMPHVPQWPGWLVLTLFAYSVYAMRVINYWYLVQLFGIVWLTDIGAYFSGKYFGGPKLLVDISPNKTVSGFLGGTLCGVLCGILFSTPWRYCLLLSLLAQLGDFLESYAKRIAKTKDSNLIGFHIPGHGGILDRIDGLLLSAPVYYAIVLK